MACFVLLLFLGCHLNPNTKKAVKNILRFLVVCATALTCNLAHAGLALPYTNDVHTLHLWHFDDPAITNLSGVNTNIYAADAVSTSPITLTNAGLPVNLSPPYTNTVLGVPGAPTLGTCYSASSKNAMMYGGTNADVTQFCNATSGAFTFEALVNINAPFTVNLPNQMEIVSGDNTYGLANRGWQFRINTARQIEFNLLGGNGSDNDWKANLPVTSGPDQAVQGQWYHVAVTFTGLSPTNSDTAGVLSFYWTLLDGSRTNADLLATFNMTRNLNGSASTPDPASGTVWPSTGICGSSRNYSGTIANGEGVIGYVDEVRISNIARASNGMAFIPGGIFPAKFTTQPPTNTLIGYGQTLSLAPLVSGTSVTEQWQLTNTSGGGFTNMPGETNSALVISNVTFASSEAYRLVISNVLNMATSVVAQVAVGAAASELFDTGVDASGVPINPLATPVADLHYFLAQSADITYLGPAAAVWNMTAYPMALYNGNFANADSASCWIGDEGAQGYASPAGLYIYRTYFLLDSVDLTQPFSIQGIWYENETGTNILINGLPTGNYFDVTNSVNGKYSAPFKITNGFVPGLNTLDFVTLRLPTPTNTAYEESALRVEFTAGPNQAYPGEGWALPPGLPTILQNPAPQSVSDASNGVSAVVNFSVVAQGRPPLSYQWLDQNSAPISGATSRTLSYVGPTAGAAQPTAFSCKVSNDSGSVTSLVASLTLIATNIPPVAPSYSYEIYTNQVLTISFDSIFASAYDQNGLPLTYVYFDANGTNGASSITQTVTGGTTLTYTPAADQTGHDSFTYTLTDPNSVQAVGTIYINVVAGPLQPTFAPAVSFSNGKVVLTGSGGTPGGPYSLLATSSITNALATWTNIGSFYFDGSGNFNITNAVTPGTPAQFFIIQLP